MTKGKNAKQKRKSVYRKLLAVSNEVFTMACKCLKELETCPVLEAAASEPTPEGLVAGVRRHARPEDAERVADAVRAVMVEEISLLTRLIGEDLVRTILQSGLDRRPDPGAESETPADG